MGKLVTLYRNNIAKTRSPMFTACGRKTFAQPTRTGKNVYDGIGRLLTGSHRSSLTRDIGTTGP